MGDPAEQKPLSNWRIAGLSCLAGFGNGYNMNVANPALKFLHDTEYDFDKDLDGFIMASIFAGGCIGALQAGYLAERMGRRKVSLLGESIVVVFCCLQCLAFHPAILIINRTLLGFGIGICMVAKPLFVAELSPPALRGRLLSCNPFCYTLSLFVIYGCNILFKSVLSPMAAFVVLILLGAIPPACLLAFVYFVVPESPFWLSRNQAEEATKAEVEPLKVGNEQEEGKLTVCALSKKGCQDPAIRSIFAVAFFLVSANQATGVTVMQLFAQDAVTWTGEKEQMVLVCTGMACAGATLSLVLTDRMSRRPQMLAGLSGMLSCTVIMLLLHTSSAGSGWQLAFLSLNMFCFTGFVGPVFLASISEIYSNEYRSCGMGVAVTLLFSIAILTQIFFVIGGKDVTAFFAATVVIQFGVLVYLACYMPETHGRSFVTAKTSNDAV